MDVLKQVEELMLPICAMTGTDLIDLVYEQENGNQYLRIFVDTDAGLTMDECVQVTELISEKLDEKDFIAEEYMLEVSSPGAERPLKSREDLEGAVGAYINVQVKEKIDDIGEFQGDLLAIEGESLILECLFKTRKKKVHIDYENVKKARLAVRF